MPTIKDSFVPANSCVTPKTCEHAGECQLAATISYEISQAKSGNPHGLLRLLRLANCQSAAAREQVAIASQLLIDNNRIFQLDTTLNPPK